jgi:hypothetical protein
MEWGDRDVKLTLVTNPGYYLHRNVTSYDPCLRFLCLLKLVLVLFQLSSAPAHLCLQWSSSVVHGPCEQCKVLLSFIKYQSARKGLLRRSAAAWHRLLQ